MKPEVFNLLVGLGFLAVFPLWWSLVLWMISRIGGWASLAGKYAAGRRPEGVNYSWRSMRISPLMGYNNCLEVTLSREGIFMVPFVLFRAGHRPLLIPWSCIGSLEEGRARSCYFPIEAAGRKARLWVPCSAREWMRANR